MQETMKATKYVCDGCERTHTTIYDPPHEHPGLNGSLNGWRVCPCAIVCPICLTVVKRLEVAGVLLDTVAPEWRRNA